MPHRRPQLAPRAREGPTKRRTRTRIRPPQTPQGRTNHVAIGMTPTPSALRQEPAVRVGRRQPVPRLTGARQRIRAISQPTRATRQPTRATRQPTRAARRQAFPVRLGRLNAPCPARARPSRRPAQRPNRRSRSPLRSRLRSRHRRYSRSPGPVLPTSQGAQEASPAGEEDPLQGPAALPSRRMVSAVRLRLSTRASNLRRAAAF
jgi:hypothetical protein